MDETKMALDFFEKNFERIIGVAKKIYQNTDEIIQIKLKSAYTSYIQKSSDKYSKSKSFFIRTQSVDLYDYYVAAAIECAKIKINDPSFSEVIYNSHRTVLLGSGGSGKSVLMRHLFLSCVVDGRYAPIMVELRDLNSGSADLEKFIEGVLDSFGFNISGEYIRRAKDAGHFFFFFDGFDELNLSLRSSVINQISAIEKKYPLCPILISSRPDDEFEGKETLNLFKILPLSLDSAVKLVEKLPFDEEIKRKFIVNLKNELFETHKSFLSNPLLLSIMLLTYGENAEIPSKLSIFYNQAYEALFQRHDAIKGAYSRGRRTSLDIQDFSRVFSMFSLQTYDRRLIKMSRLECLEYLNRSKLALHMNFNTDDYLNDLMSAACLMGEDGLEIAYSHRSFQEYFVAVHISNSSPEVQKKLINRFKKNVYTDNVMHLLLEINPDLIERELLLPSLQNLFTELKVIHKVGVTHYLRYLKYRYNSFNVDGVNVFATHHNRHVENLPDLAGMVTKHMRTYDWSLVENDDPDAEYLTSLSINSQTTIKTKTLKSSDPFFKYLKTSAGVFSLAHLQATWEGFKILEKKHKNSVESLDLLLKD